MLDARCAMRASRLGRSERPVGRGEHEKLETANHQKAMARSHGDGKWYKNRKDVRRRRVWRWGRVAEARQVAIWIDCRVCDAMGGFWEGGSRKDGRTADSEWPCDRTERRGCLEIGSWERLRLGMLGGEVCLGYRRESQVIGGRDGTDCVLGWAERVLLACSLSVSVSLPSGLSAEWQAHSRVIGACTVWCWPRANKTAVVPC